jgi:starch-binding outer membrane protein, SusD/RagB family
MKKNIIFSFLLCTAVMIGCDTGMNIAPTASVTEEIFWERDSDVRQAVNAVYAEMDGRPMTLDNRTDIAYTQLTPLVASDGTVSGTWARYYRGIRRANDVINNIDQVEFGDMELVQRLGAEARFLRAYYYTQLTSLYGDVPFLTETIGIDEHIGRTDREVIVDFIIDELDNIINTNALPVSYSGNNLGRATHGAAESLKARVALRNERWAIARDAAQSVMDSGVYSLYPDYEGLFQYEGQNSSEVIFDRQYTADGQNFSAFGHSATSLGGGAWVEPYHGTYLLFRLDEEEYNVENFDDPMEPYENMDPRWYHSVYYTGSEIGDGNIFDSHPQRGSPDAANVTETATELGYNMKKYVDFENDRDDPGRGSINFIHIRYADVLLMYAEAKVQLGEIDQSVYDAINEVRQRPTVELDPISPATHPDAESLMDYLIEERGREFVFEGLRLFDIHRWGNGVELVSGPKLGAHYENLETGDIFLWDIGRSQTFQEHHHLWPVPQAEINANSEISGADQNPGY